MKKARYSETQVIRVMNEVVGRRQVKEVCRGYGISDQTYYNWQPSGFGAAIGGVPP